MRERAKVVEHRITTHYHRTIDHDIVIDHYIVRWWIESDPDFGGVDHDAAHRAVEGAMLSLYETTYSQDRRASDEEIANFLLERVPSANSVEVCNDHGNGVTIHRDWP